MAAFTSLVRKVPAYGGRRTETVNAGEFVTCGRGHQMASLSRGFDPEKNDHYVEAVCHHKGCPARQRVYDQERMRATE